MEAAVEAPPAAEEQPSDAASDTMPAALRLEPDEVNQGAQSDQLIETSHEAEVGEGEASDSVNIRTPSNAKDVEARNNDASALQGPNYLHSAVMPPPAVCSPAVRLDVRFTLSHGMNFLLILLTVTLIYLLRYTFELSRFRFIHCFIQC